jgi:hypothetical protein
MTTQDRLDIMERERDVAWLLWWRSSRNGDSPEVADQLFRQYLDLANAMIDLMLTPPGNSPQLP